jgi:hypothetical protein
MDTFPIINGGEFTSAVVTTSVQSLYITAALSDLNSVSFPLK